MRGQTAGDYLKAYGWVLVIILIIVGLFLYFDYISPQRKSCYGVLNIALDDWKYDKNGTFVFNIGNSVGRSVNITTINARVEEQTESIDLNRIIGIKDKTSNITISGLPQKSEEDIVSIGLEIYFLVPGEIGGEKKFICNLEGKVGEYVSPISSIG